jgi:hypothetical protein
MRLAGILLLGACAAACSASRGEEPQDHAALGSSALPRFRKVATEHLGQLTGTARNPMAPLGLVGTDLGASFERDGKLVFLFGDSWMAPGGFRQNQDSVAWTTATELPTFTNMPKLTWISDAHGQFVAPRLPGIDLGGMNVPVEGIAVGSKTFVFFTTGWDPGTHRYSHAVLAEMNGLDVPGLRTLHVVPSSKFLNVSAVVEGNTAWIYGSGDYRTSAVYLAKVDVARLADRNAWSYLGAGGAFGAGEGSAVPVVDTRCVGELSVRKWDQQGLYFMAYNCGDPEPRGITLRWARSPAGPWSEPLVIFDPGKDVDHGYEHFIHANQALTRYDDGLSERDRYEEWGGEYGPYLIPRYFAEETGGVLSVVYSMSSWNPYQSHLMRTKIALADNPIVLPNDKGAGLPRATLQNGDFSAGLSGWRASGQGFGVAVGPDGKRHVTTFVAPAGDAVVGQLSQEFTVDAVTRELSFFVHGGDARVVLMRGDEVVRSTTGRRTNDVRMPVVWTLTEFRGETLRVVVDDSLTGSWGFVSASEFSLR